MSEGGTYLNSQIVDRVVENIRTSVIAVTEDKLENVLIKHDEIRKNKDAWQNPLSVALAILLTIVTTEPKNALGLSKETWTALFYLLLFTSLVLLIKGLNQWRKSLGKSSIKHLISLIKNDSPTAVSTEKVIGKWEKIKNWIRS